MEVLAGLGHLVFAVVSAAAMFWVAPQALARELDDIAAGSFPAVTFGVLLGVIALLALALILGAV